MDTMACLLGVLINWVPLYKEGLITNRYSFDSFLTLLTEKLNIQRDFSGKYDSYFLDCLLYADL